MLHAGPGYLGGPAPTRLRAGSLRRRSSWRVRAGIFNPIARHLHDETQAGIRRPRCVACAYAAGLRAGELAASANKRVSAWTLNGAAEMCEEGRSAPEVMLAALAWSSCRVAVAGFCFEEW